MHDVSEFAKQYAMSLKVGFGADRRKTVGASESGLCSRRVANRKFGVAPDKPDDTSGFAVRGNVMEDHWSAPLFIAWALHLGGEMLYAGQANQLSLKAPKAFLSATPDGLMVGVPNDTFAKYGLPDLGNNQCVVEFKSIDPRVGAHKLPKPENVKQTMQQIGLIRSGTEYKPNFGVVVYTNASDYFDIKPFPVAWEESRFKGLAVRAKGIMGVEDPNQLPPEGKIAGGDECRMCEYAESCLGFIPWLATEEEAKVTAKKLKPIEALAKEIIAADVASDAAKTLKGELEARMYEELGKVKTRFVKSKSVVVVAKKTASQSRYNIEMLKKRIEELGGAHDDCKKDTKEGTSLTVELV